MTPTQAGFTGVLPTTLYREGRGYGWTRAVDSYALTDRTGIRPNTGLNADLINDMAVWVSTSRMRRVFNAASRRHRAR